MKKYPIYFLFSCLAIIFTSCLVAPDYPDVPHISAKPIRFIDKEKDSIVIDINFQDGKGDLGLSSEDQEFPFAQYNYITTNGKRDSVLNENFNNIFVKLLIKNSDGEFQEFIFPPGTATLNARFPRMVNSKSETAIKGTLSYYKEITSGFKSVISNKTIKFLIKIKDRKLLESNTVETDSLKIPKL